MNNHKQVLPGAVHHRLVQVIRWCVVILILFFMVRIIISRWDEVKNTSWHFNSIYLCCSFIILSIRHLLMPAIFRNLLLFAGSEMLISEVFVMEEARGEGVGSSLIEAMETEAVKQRCFRISVLNSRERESYKRGFYPSMGYEEREGTAVFIKRLDWG